MVDLRILDIVAFLVSVIILSYAAYSDIQSREVTNKAWIIYLPIAIIISVLRLFYYPSLFTISLISITLITCLSFLMFYIGLFGGADSKALICLGIVLPTSPHIILNSHFYFNPLFPLAIFYNAYLLSISVVAYNLIKNVQWKKKSDNNFFNNYPNTSVSIKILAFLTGYKTDYQTLQEKVYLYPMEEAVQENGKFIRKLKFFTDAEINRDDQINTLRQSLPSNDRGEVWVSPGIPMLVFILIALIIVPIIGDLLFWIVSDLVSNIFLSIMFY